MAKTCVGCRSLSARAVLKEIVTQAAVASLSYIAPHQNSAKLLTKVEGLGPETANIAIQARYEIHKFLRSSHHVFCTQERNHLISLVQNATDKLHNALKLLVNPPIFNLERRVRFP